MLSYQQPVLIHLNLLSTLKMLSGAARAKDLLNGVPNRFYDFSRMDQFTFVQLADWCIENVQSTTGEDVSIEECLLIFLDIVGHGTSFKSAAQTWGHNEELIKKYALPPHTCIC